MVLVQNQTKMQEEWEIQPKMNGLEAKPIVVLQIPTAGDVAKDQLSWLVLCFVKFWISGGDSRASLRSNLQLTFRQNGTTRLLQL